MYQFNNLTSNVPNVQTFNAAAATTYQSQGTTSYVYLGVNVSGVPAANGDLYQRTTTIIAYFKTDSTGATAPIPKVSGQFTYGDGTAVNGWFNAIITAVTDSGTFWLITVGTAFAGTLTTSTTYTLETKTAISPWQTWTKPNDALLIHILCIGGGGGGGGGRRQTTIGNKYGGGGGGSSAVTSMYVPAFLIPDTLYIQVGRGGAGGAGTAIDSTSGSAGITGGTSYVALYPSYTGTGEVGNLLLSANGGAAGGAGTNASGSGGAGGTATAVGASSPFYLGLGQFTSTAGQAGSSSNTLTAPTALTISGITCGGGAGGGASSGTYRTGGTIVSPSPLIPYLTSLGVSANGYAVKKPLMFVGGTGGNGSALSVAGNGGRGSIGSGGGGGGAGGNAASGSGNLGGDGIVIITSYSI